MIIPHHLSNACLRSNSTFSTHIHPGLLHSSLGSCSPARILDYLCFQSAHPFLHFLLDLT